MARKSRYMGYKNAARTMRNAPEVPKRGTAHESIRQRLMRLKAKDAEDGDIVVALIDNENTLKRFYRDQENHCIRLHPENKSMKDLIVPECEIQGVAVDVIKALL